MNWPAAYPAGESAVYALRGGSEPALCACDQAGIRWRATSSGGTWVWTNQSA